ncbi:MAG TPA: right-handed parallel beta-helix repeat-containing protein [Micromonosporaceae bacterium]|nr:right-handed parallel beta-helix repeat-containing protein [Micromonosporaceae bacterium]
MRLIHGTGLAAVAATAVLVFAAAPADAAMGTQANTVRVVAPGHSIQAAVNAAHPGDTIKLLAGNYAGGILVKKNGITIRGAGRATILRDTGTNHCTAVAGPSGICVLNPKGGVVDRVTIKNLQVKGFDAFGVVGFQTNRLTVTGVTAVNNDEYGITEFESTRGTFVGNLVIGTTGEAALYVGDIADAHGTTVAGNVAIGNALGILVRHAHDVTVKGNTFVGNCVGVALVNDDQAGGQGDTRVIDNVLAVNNRSCPSSDEAPPLGGSGVVIFGGKNNTIRGNTIVDNRGNPNKSPFAGGVVLVPSEKNSPAKHNTIVDNVILRNSPADIIDNGGGPNTFHDNTCGTSHPAGLCHD